MPEWVQVWIWLRARGNFAALPQQDERNPETISSEQYARLLDEWRRTGSPQMDNPLLDDGIPF